MGEGGIPIEIQQSTEANGKGITLYRNDNLEIFVPEKPGIPQEEGIHVKVSDGNDNQDSPKQVLNRFLFGLASAKVVAESSQTPQEPWANTRIEKDQMVSVYGRNAFNPSSWRKPVDTVNRSVSEINTLNPEYNEQKLKTLFKKYIPKWEKLTSIMSLFPEGVDAQDVNNEDFKDYAVIWRSNTHTITIQKEPHLAGYHLVVHANEAMARQWQTVKESAQDVRDQKMVQRYIRATLEATAIAMGIQDLLSPGAGEIHNSGNWAGGLKTVEEGGALSLEGLKTSPKKEKVAHRPDRVTGESDFGTSMHVHVYIPKDKISPVILPPMSKKEAVQRINEAKQKGSSIAEYEAIIAQWDKVPNATEEEIAEVKEKISNGKLSNWLLQNAAGSLK